MDRCLKGMGRSGCKRKSLKLSEKGTLSEKQGYLKAWEGAPSRRSRRKKQWKKKREFQGSAGGEAEKKGLVKGEVPTTFNVLVTPNTGT